VSTDTFTPRKRGGFGAAAAGVAVALACLTGTANAADAPSLPSSVTCIPYQNYYLQPAKFYAYPNMMKRTPGFEAATYVGGGMIGHPAVLSAEYTDQWLQFRVWAGYHDANGDMRWIQGTTLGGYNALGAFTSGVASWVQLTPGGPWKQTAPQISDAFNDASSPEDVSFVKLPFYSSYYLVDFEYSWGPIYNKQTGQLAYAGSHLWEQATTANAGWMHC
jgi:hypothetical protein